MLKVLKWGVVPLNLKGHGMTPHSLCWARTNSPVNIRDFNYSAQQRGARPHDQYDKADRGALERIGVGGLRGRENRWTQAHIRRGGLVHRWRSAFALPPNILDVFSHPVLKCYVRRRRHGLSGF